MPSKIKTVIWKHFDRKIEVGKHFEAAQDLRLSYNLNQEENARFEYFGRKIATSSRLSDYFTETTLLK